MPFLLRAAIVGGAAYHVGKTVQGARDQDAAQQQQIDDLQAQQAQQAQPAAPAPAPSQEDSMAKLAQLKQLLDQGVLTQAEFDMQKQKILHEHVGGRTRLTDSQGGTMALGPVQLLFVGFEGRHFTGAAMEELQRLREHDIVRLVDLLVVAKDDDGNVTQVEISDRPELQEYGAVAGALLGLGAAGEEGAEAGAVAGAEAMAGGQMYDPEDVWVLAEQIPPGMTAAIALLEHRWAIPLREAIAGRRRGGPRRRVDPPRRPRAVRRRGGRRVVRGEFDLECDGGASRRPRRLGACHPRGGDRTCCSGYCF